MFSNKKTWDHQTHRDNGPLPDESKVFRPNHGCRVKATIHSTGSSSSGFRLRQSAPTLSRPRMARNKKRYGCRVNAQRISRPFWNFAWRRYCNLQLATRRSSPAESFCRMAAPIQMYAATVNRINVHISGNHKMGGSLVRILSVWCVRSRASWQVTSCGSTSAFPSVSFCGGFIGSNSGPWVIRSSSGMAAAVIWFSLVLAESGPSTIMAYKAPVKCDDGLGSVAPLTFPAIKS